MSSNRDLERRIADFYAQEGWLRAPDRVLTSALTTIENTPQRRVLSRVPWRLRNMNRYFGVAAAAAVLLIVAAVGFALYNGRPAPPGATPLASPFASAAPSPTTAAPSPSLTAGPALSETFTSDLHGITVSYPAGWSLQPATQAWTSGLLHQAEPFADVIYEKEADTAFIAVASRPLVDETLDQFAADYLSAVAAEGGPCSLTQEPITVDGIPGVIDSECPIALVATEGRGYVIWLYRIDDRDYFEAILATVQLDPSSALQSSEPFGATFAFRFPEGPTWEFGVINPTYFEVRVPEYANAGHPGGLIAQVVGSGLEDPCNPESAELPIDPGPQSVIDYLGTVPGITLVEESATTVDGLEGVQATVPGTTEPPPCDAFLWAGDPEPFTAIPVEVERRVIAVDVGDEHVVFTTFGEDTNPRMTDLIDELIGSIRFD